MSTAARLLRIAILVAYFTIVAHEVETGGKYIGGVAVKLTVTCGMAPFAAHNCAAAILLVIPLIAYAGMLVFTKKEKW